MCVHQKLRLWRAMPAILTARAAITGFAGIARSYCLIKRRIMFALIKHFYFS